MTQYTKGPWKIKDSANEGAIVERTKNLSNQIVPIEDAFLIAAAPELLEALKALQDLTWHSDNNGRTEADYIRVKKQVRDAIAKAEGK